MAWASSCCRARHGARRIVVGLGGSGTNDGGAGCFAVPGAGSIEGPRPRRPSVGGYLGPDAFDALTSTIAEWSDIDLLAATGCDDSASLGLAARAPSSVRQKGVSPLPARPRIRLGHFCRPRPPPLRPAASTCSLAATAARSRAGRGERRVAGCCHHRRRERVGGADLVLAAVDFAAPRSGGRPGGHREVVFDWQSPRGSMVAWRRRVRLTQPHPRSWRQARSSGLPREHGYRPRRQCRRRPFGTPAQRRRRRMTGPVAPLVRSGPAGWPRRGQPPRPRSGAFGAYHPARDVAYISAPLALFQEPRQDVDHRNTAAKGPHSAAVQRRGDQRPPWRGH